LSQKAYEITEGGAAMDYQFLMYEEREAVAVITLNRQ